MYKNYIFDLGNVILLLTWEKILDKYSDNEDEKELLKNTIFNSTEWQLLDEGTISKEEGLRRIKNNLPIELHYKCEQIFTNWKNALTINYDMIELIKGLRKNGAKTFILSNAPVDIPVFIKDNDLLKYFDNTVYSAEINMLKPSKDIYEYAINKFGINPQETLFIDDKAENIAGAKSCDLNGFVFDYNNMSELIEKL